MFSPSSEWIRVCVVTKVFIQFEPLHWLEEYCLFCNPRLEIRREFSELIVGLCSNQFNAPTSVFICCCLALVRINIKYTVWVTRIKKQSSIDYKLFWADNNVGIVMCLGESASDSKSTVAFLSFHSDKWRHSEKRRPFRSDEMYRNS